MLPRFAHGPETIRLGDLTVRRLGYGAMRLPGKDVWGEPADPATAHAVLRRAIELGINFIDTAWYYGPFVANRLIAEALHPYPTDLVIATKVGGKRLEDRSTIAALTPDELRAAVDADLETLRLEQLPVVHLRWFEKADVSFAEALDALIDIQRTGKIRHLALSNVSFAQVQEARAKTPIVAVQNLYNVGAAGSEASDEILALCEHEGLAFIPYFPLGGVLAGGGGPLDPVARRLDCSPVQLAIAWLLARSPAILPIPGTSKVTHLEENVGAVHFALDPTTLEELAPKR